MDRLKKIRSKFRFSKNFAIIGHINPDGDAICSALAFKHWIELNYKKKDVQIFFDGDVDSLYEPIIGDVKLNQFPTRRYDVVIVLDSQNPSRLGKYQKILGRRWVLNVDHHQNNTMFGTVNICLTKASSTGEILWFLLKQLSSANGTQLNVEIIKYLYTAILTDTVCFTSSSTTSRTHKLVSDMLCYNFDFENIRNYFFGNNAKSKTFLLTQALKSLRFYFKDTISIMRLSQQDFEKTDTEFSDSLGIIDQGLNISGVKIAAIFIEKDIDSYHVSIRSKGNIDVSVLAKEFNGGGHKNMAAFQYEGNIKDLVNNFVKSAIAILDSLPNEGEDNDFIF
ncbi:MAG: bifunctional oligoribonuclease/PAP phosphatase NrnA [Clostridia bacterium]|nr:bifunctional oligoribonuclease/PAP phosphatase NrnA [Clostridia bacterium]